MKNIFINALHKSQTIHYKLNLLQYVLISFSETLCIDSLFKFYLDDEDRVGVGLVGGDEGEVAEDGRDRALHFDVFVDKLNLPIHCCLENVLLYP